jgi:sortase (surface protein transpeptidase)
MGVRLHQTNEISWRLLALLLLLWLSACASASPNPRKAEAHLAFSSPTSTATPTANPMHLLIPAIGVNALVESVGVQSNGDLATPTGSPWEDVGWYNGGPRPGERGSAVIDGHVDRPGGLPAVFWYLRNLKVGDTVQVSDSAGNTLQFHVTRLAFYRPQEAPLQDIFGNQGGTYLNLITCAGDWIPSQHQTTLRLVVYTALG